MNRNRPQGRMENTYKLIFSKGKFFQSNHSGGPADIIAQTICFTTQCFLDLDRTKASCGKKWKQYFIKPAASGLSH